MKMLTYRLQKKLFRFLCLIFIFGYTLNLLARTSSTLKEQKSESDSVNHEKEDVQIDDQDISENPGKTIVKDDKGVVKKDKPQDLMKKREKKQGELDKPKANHMDPLQPPKLKSGPGEMGEPVKVDVDKLPLEEQYRYKNLTLKYGFHAYVGDMISERRSLPDFRDEKCKEPGRYPANLPKSSVILCFHNEAWSALLRSVNSILNRSPAHLLEEVILVDDFSNFDNLKKPLEDYVKQYPKVKIVRTSKREGLMRARTIGAKAAVGPILIFLDSHIECAEGWLEPLAAVIHENPKASVAPIIETIDQVTFELRGTKCVNNYVGSFTWNLGFDWIAIPDRVAKSLDHPCDPIPSATMAGGLFGIGKEFFENLGYYDSQMDVWGAENLELSFKIWMCGGKLYQVPCSHIGHIFRAINPYGSRSAELFGNFVRKNTLRLAEVWLDEYKDIYYARNGPKKPTDNIGDLTEVIAKRSELKCKKFSWYLKNVCPEIFVPSEGPAYGEVRNMGKLDPPQCLDALKEGVNNPPGPYSCHGLGYKQFWTLTEIGEVRNDYGCLDYFDQKLILYPCHGGKGNQLWIYRVKTKQLYHKGSNKCLGIIKQNGNEYKLTAVNCNPLDGLNQWTFSNVNQTFLTQVENSLLSSS